MLAFMRKYQKYFFAIITVVIVISFSFFGTYSTLAGNSIHETVAFRTVGGDDVSRSELEEMAFFIGTDLEDKKLFGGIWGPNFLNDGVIRKDFLETGLASLLVGAYPDLVQSDFKNRWNKEVRYRPYVHPYVKFITSGNVWRYFAPEMEKNLEAFQRTKDPLSEEAIDLRVQLFLAERRFPSPYLKQMLLYQQNNGNFQKDQTLEHQDLSLFGYHTVDDWFGNRFVRLLSEFIFNAASIAESKGYRVSKEEALADLRRNAEISFQENRSNPQLAVQNSTEYFDQQLMRMRLDKTKAAKIWQKVLLFRRLFDDVASASFIDSSMYTAFNSYANKGVKGDLYKLPENLRFSDFRKFQRFETYLDLVAKRKKEEKNSLVLPKEFLTAAELAKKAPELVQKHYILEVAKTNKKELEAKVTMKQALSWELDAKNWKTITDYIPELATKKSDDKLELLDKLDDRTRMRLDSFAREQIVAAHPEWIEQALNEIPMQEISLNLAFNGQNPIFEGSEVQEKLMPLLDQLEIGKELSKITFDKEHYYKVKVLKRSGEPSILTFEEADRANVLDGLTKQALEIAYIQMRVQDPGSFQNADKSWKPFNEVQDQVAALYFQKTLDSIRSQLKNRPDKDKYQHIDGERLAGYRFLQSAEDLLALLKKDPSQGNAFVIQPDAEKTFQNQFRFIKTPLNLSRKSEQNLLQPEKLLALKENEWSSTILSPNGDVYFAQVLSPNDDSGSSEILQEQIKRARYLLGNDAERTYLLTLIPLLKEKNAISMDYLYAGETSLE